jgi:hypothetical protein
LEPLTTGIASGPGAGPEAITPPSPLLQAVTTLAGLGSAANADVTRMRDVLSAALANENLR